MNTSAHTSALESLIARAEPRRLQRTPNVLMWDWHQTPQGWTGTACGSSGGYYQCSLTLVDQRTFNCTCPDKAQRGRLKGPCKHVLRLVQHALRELRAA